MKPKPLIANLATVLCISRGTARAYTWSDFSRQLVFVLAIFTVSNIVTYWTSGYFEKERRYHEIVTMAGERPGVRVLFAGDSHFAEPLTGYLNDEPSTAAYSVAFGGDSARECFAKIRRVLESNPAIDTLVVSADPHMFGSGRITSANRAFADRYFLAARDRSGLPNGWMSAMLDQVPLFNDDFVQYLRKLASVGFTHKSAAPDASGGGASSWASLSEADRAAEARRTGQMDHQGVGDYKEPFYWYERILQLANARHIRVIGVRFPVHAEYSAQAPPERVARIDSFLRQAGIAEVVDLRNALSDPHDFFDPDHVNPESAGKVLRLLSRSVQRPSSLAGLPDSETSRVPP